MGLDVTVGVATFGDDLWLQLGRDTACGAGAHGVPVIHTHAGSLADARNAILDTVTTEFVIYLDADDLLEPGYIDAMAAVDGDIRVPAVRYVTPDSPHLHPAYPRVVGHHHDCDEACLTEGNWIVIGACARVELLRDVGGWEAWPIFEDWALWLRCWQAGCRIERAPDAVYQALVQSDSRNRTGRIDHGACYREIREAILA